MKLIKRACNTLVYNKVSSVEKEMASRSSILAWRIHGLYSPWGCQELDMTEGLSLHFQEIWPESRLNWSLPVSSGISSLKPAKTHRGAFPGSPRSQLDRKSSVVQTSWQTSRRGLTGRRPPSGLRAAPGPQQEPALSTPGLSSALLLRPAALPWRAQEGHQLPQADLNPLPQL